MHAGALSIIARWELQDTVDTRGLETRFARNVFEQCQEPLEGQDDMEREPVSIIDDSLG